MNSKQLTRYSCGLALAGLLVSAVSAWAQTSVFTYQGRLTFQGYSANGNYDLTFKLFDALENGNQIGSTITNANLAVSNGLFTATLDFGSSGFPGADRWLELGVRTNGDTGDFATLVPRQQLTAAPYAVTAAGFTGAVQDSQLSANVARTNQANTFYGEVKASVGGVNFFMVPQGAVVLWSGSTVNIPSGWALCDGANGTPDLRDKFVVGAGSSYAVNDTGGAVSHTHDTAIGTPTTSSNGAHTHTTIANTTGGSTTGSESGHTHSIDPPSTVTSSTGSHTHGAGTLNFARGITTGASHSSGSYTPTWTSGGASTWCDVDWTGATASGGTHTHTVDIAGFTSGAGSSHSHSIPGLSIPALGTDSQGAHTHTVSIGTITSTSASSLPPYYALCYIMKL